MPSLISTTTPLGTNVTYTSGVSNITSASKITGSVYADQPGTLYIDQGVDNTHFDISTKYVLNGLDTAVVNLDVACQYLRVRFVNGAVPQTVLRLYVDIRDAWGAFLSHLSPSSGGSWIALYFNPGTLAYEVVGRFESDNGWLANSAAAIAKGRNGKYASFPVIDATVTQETLQEITDHTTDSF